MENTLQERLRFEASRLNNMWGKSPTADMMREAADALDKAEAPAPAPKKTTAKKGS